MALSEYQYTRLKKIITKGKDGQAEHDNITDQMVQDIYIQAESLTSKYVSKEESGGVEWGERFDDILTSRWLGFPIMLLMLAGIFWITITGANYLSAILADWLFWVEEQLVSFFTLVNAPAWLNGILVLGVYRTMAWVVSVMLPPMAIFFPLFTLMEDLGILPRVAFNLDNYFKRVGAHGKQALTMSMGFGCNAAGVIATRIIESPREKLIAILTNNFVPCNGRFPTLIILASLFMGSVAAGKYSSLVATAAVVGLILLGIIVTLLVSWLLSRTILKGIPSSFTLELPPYRKPQIGQILIRSFIDRTLFVLSRAVMVAAPAGAVVWLFANLDINGMSLIGHVAGFLQPVALLIGLDGVILLAFFLGLPANEIVLPITIMSYLAAGAMLEPGSSETLRQILVENGWTWVTALATMLFSLFHFPCATTLLAIKKETQSWKWPFLAAVIPLGIAIIVNLIVVQGIYLLS
ncbi:MAG: nucleoside recognition domain-containing protein [Halanaerobium sp.]|nr:nucleoside recognition domain-containing protein [Halanaerobium sp.]